MGKQRNRPPKVLSFIIHCNYISPHVTYQSFFILARSPSLLFPGSLLIPDGESMGIISSAVGLSPFVAFLVHTI